MVCLNGRTDHRHETSTFFSRSSSSSLARYYTCSSNGWSSARAGAETSPSDDESTSYSRRRLPGSLDIPLPPMVLVTIQVSTGRWTMVL